MAIFVRNLLSWAQRSVRVVRGSLASALPIAGLGTMMSAAKAAFANTFLVIIVFLPSSYIRFARCATKEFPWKRRIWCHSATLGNGPKWFHFLDEETTVDVVLLQFYLHITVGVHQGFPSRAGKSGEL